MEINIGNPKFIDANIDDLIAKIPTIQCGETVLLNFSNIKYLRPDTVIQFITFSKMAYEMSCTKVHWINLARSSASYLGRIGIGQIDFIYVEMPWFRSWEAGDTLMPLVIMRDRFCVGNIADETKKHLREWYPERARCSTFCLDAANIISEIANNSFDHSELGTGNQVFCYCTIQRYQQPQCSEPRVIIAFGDAGIGIQQSLSRRWGSVKSDESAIREAFFKGKSSRNSTERDWGLPDEGGLGFSSVRKMLQQNSGHIVIRSGTASLKYDLKNDFRHYRRHKESLAGTQTVLVL